MYKYKKIIYLNQTDATGAIYFTELLKMVSETLENYFFSKGFSLRDMVGFQLPVVHAEADFKGAIRVGDEVEVEIELGDVGTSSFTILGRVIGSKELGIVKIVHVAVAEGKSIPIPEKVLAELRKL